MGYHAIFAVMGNWIWSAVSIRNKWKTTTGN